MYNKFLKNTNPQKQINQLSKKYHNKKIIIYGTGQYAHFVMEHYNLSKLPIIGFSDKIFIENKNRTFYNYQTFSPLKLKEIDFDVLLILDWDDYQIYKYLAKEIKLDLNKITIDVLPKFSFKQYIQYIIKLISNLVS